MSSSNRILGATFYYSVVHTQNQRFSRGAGSGSIGDPAMGTTLAVIGAVGGLIVGVIIGKKYLS